MVRGRVEQGMFFLDVRHRKLYTVIGQTHWEDPKQAFLQALGDTFAVKGRVWRQDGSAAIVITDAWPYRDQPQPVFNAPGRGTGSGRVLLGCGLFACRLRRWR